MKILILFLILTTIILITSAQFSDHARERSEERNIDLYRAQDAIRLGTAWKVSQELRNGTLRHNYEGYYKQNRRKVYFHLVRNTQGDVITVWKLTNRLPFPPMNRN
ncbi:hypothetical protein PVAND_011073 [Polypedilum vanderplanki]|uniref:Cystatin n=1 Tax=Polypedilum vanderplanki TaxID=319348 RepID=A0A9J6CIW2_POLVA|nr:hypothetical protein PVAND_011073 [Polypedilum vanderplanki]